MKPQVSLRAGILLLGTALATAFLVACSGDDESQPSVAEHESHNAAATETAAFHDAMRALWEDHIAWTRLAIVSIAADLPDATATTERLLRNQVDIGNAIKPYYGDAAGEQLTILLKDHIVIAAEIVSGAKAGDTTAVEEAQARWYGNGDQIGAFLGAANPDHWQVGEMQSMMRDHLDLTLQEAVHYLTGEYEASVADYDEIHQQILSMADMLANGIVGQFSDRFATR